MSFSEKPSMSMSMRNILDVNSGNRFNEDDTIDIDELASDAV